MAPHLHAKTRADVPLDADEVRARCCTDLECWALKVHPTASSMAWVEKATAELPAGRETRVARHTIIMRPILAATVRERLFSTVAWLDDGNHVDAWLEDPVP